jgi:hypothetical protein
VMEILVRDLLPLAARWSVFAQLSSAAAPFTGSFAGGLFTGASASTSCSSAGTCARLVVTLWSGPGAR